MPLLTSADFDAIRLKMGFPRGAMGFLPDQKFIDLRATERAEEWVASKTSDTGEHAVEAARAYAAYYMLPKCRGELYAAYNAIGANPPTSSERANRDDLLREAEAEIAGVTEVEAPTLREPQGTTSTGVSIRF